MVSLDAIRDGLYAGEFFLEYMPTIALAEQRCVGAEALIRWRQPSGVIPPDAFIPQVEHSIVAGELTFWVIDTIAAELSDWLENHPQSHISINIPPVILGRGGLRYAIIKSGLVKYRHQLILEVTERGVPDQLGLDAIEDNIKHHECQTALDDVTLTGINLALWSRCEFDMIKLDRSLVAQITDATPNPRWLSGLAGLLRSSSFQVTAEGIETQLQAQVLHDAGITMAQGYHFSRPISAPDFQVYHAKSNSND